MLTDHDSLQFGAPVLDGAPLVRREPVPYSARLPGVHAGRWRRLRLALIARWRGAELDRQLAAGGHARSGTLLGVHAERITSRRVRSRVADGLARALRDAAVGPGFGAAVPPDRHEVLAAHTVLTALDRRLRAPEPVSPHGVAMLQELLTDGSGPLYRPGEAGALGSQLRAAAAALELGRRR